MNTPTASASHDPAVLRTLLLDLCHALQPWHAAGRWHGGLRLDNLMRQLDGRLVLPPVAAERQLTGDANQLTPDGIAPGYAAFEQYTDDPAWPCGPWTDLYAIGAIAYTWLHGTPPPAAPERVLNDTLRPLAFDAPADIPRTWLSALDRCLSFDIAARPVSLEMFLAEAQLEAPLAGVAVATLAAPSAGNAGAVAAGTPATSVDDDLAALDRALPALQNDEAVTAAPATPVAPAVPVPPAAPSAAPAPTAPAAELAASAALVGAAAAATARPAHDATANAPTPSTPVMPAPVVAPPAATPAPITLPPDVPPATTPVTPPVPPAPPPAADVTATASVAAAAAAAPIPARPAPAPTPAPEAPAPVAPPTAAQRTTPAAAHTAPEPAQPSSADTAASNAAVTPPAADTPPVRPASRWVETNGPADQEQETEAPARARPPWLIMGLSGLCLVIAGWLLLMDDSPSDDAPTQAAAGSSEPATPAPPATPPAQAATSPDTAAANANDRGNEPAAGTEGGSSGWTLPWDLAAANIPDLNETTTLPGTPLSPNDQSPATASEPTPAPATTPPLDTALPSSGETAPAAALPETAPAPTPEAETTAPAQTPAEAELAASVDNAAATVETPPPSGPVTVRLQILPWAEVSINGQVRGVSPPLKQLSLAPGSYTVTLRNGDLPPYQRQIQVEAGQPLVISHQFQ